MAISTLRSPENRFLLLFCISPAHALCNDSSCKNNHPLSSIYLFIYLLIHYYYNLNGRKRIRTLFYNDSDHHQGKFQLEKYFNKFERLYLLAIYNYQARVKWYWWTVLCLKIMFEKFKTKSITQILCETSIALCCIFCTISHDNKIK